MMDQLVNKTTKCLWEFHGNTVSRPLEHYHMRTQLSLQMVGSLRRDHLVVRACHDQDRHTTVANCGQTFRTDIMKSSRHGLTHTALNGLWWPVTEHLFDSL